MTTADETVSPLSGQEQPRESLITTAVTFLSNKDVQRHPLSQKHQFLRSKGLTESEIQLACERAGVFTGDLTMSRSRSTTINMESDRQSHLMQKKPLRRGLFQQLIDISHSIVTVSGIAYCIYWLYQRFIRPYLFGEASAASRRATVDESIKALEVKVEKKIDDLALEIVRVREDLNKNQFQNIKNDLDVIKGLLLNKKQFAHPVVPPSIPAWQLAAAATSQQQLDEDHDKEQAEHLHQDEDTGSGSSETEVVTKNSDSSLEIM